MGEKAYTSLSKEHSNIFIKSLNSSIEICKRIHECCSCPLYDAEMDNLHDASCFPVLLSDYASKLSRDGNDLEEKGE